MLYPLQRERERGRGDTCGFERARVLYLGPDVWAGGALRGFVSRSVKFDGDNACIISGWRTGFLFLCFLCVFVCLWMALLPDFD